MALSLVVIVLGAYTRISDAGLGCPDWPGCYGQIMVPTHNTEIMRAAELFPNHQIEPKKAWLEMIHRYVAGTLGLVIAAIFALSFKLSNVVNHSSLHASQLKNTSVRKAKYWSTGLLLLVCFQAALGMWTVTLKLLPIIVVLHLFGGFLLFSLLLVFYLIIKPHSWLKPTPNQTFRRIKSLVSLQKMGWIALAVLWFQIFLGGWTSTNYAALVCTSLPLCEGAWWQNFNLNGAFTIFQHPLLNTGSTGRESFEYGVLDYNSRMTIHVLHRIGAIITTITLLIFAWRVLGEQSQPMLKHAAISLALLIFIQVGLGVANVLLHLPVLLAVAHNMVAALLLFNLVFVCTCLRLSYRSSVSLSRQSERISLN
ncbi:MAG: COX15/CtaA family protein [Vibrio sp.]